MRTASPRFEVISTGRRSLLTCSIRGNRFFRASLAVTTTPMLLLTGTRYRTSPSGLTSRPAGVGQLIPEGRAPQMGAGQAQRGSISTHVRPESLASVAKVRVTDSSPVSRCQLTTAKPHRPLLSGSETLRSQGCLAQGAVPD